MRPRATTPAFTRVTATAPSGIVTELPDHERLVFAGGRTRTHGADLGFSAAAYVAVGGFRPLATGEDCGLGT
jgi:hypothetical protein